jgi:Na+/melibiose symporter-like transporter
MPECRHETNDQRHVAGLAALFAMLYFVQGISEPTEGLIAQPTRSLLRNWGYSTEAVATFMAVLALPWALKPVYGLLTDFVPLFGTRRRSWLLITTLVTSVSLVALYALGIPYGIAWLLLVWLFVPTLGVAFSDVVVDALMVEEGQPRGLTGRLQSVQWAAMWTATIFAGVLGGWLSQRNQQHVGFLIAGSVTAASFFIAIAVVREPMKHVAGDRSGFERASSRNPMYAVWRSIRHPGILAIGVFLLLWNFNPFSTSVLNEHMVRRMGFSEQFYGNTISIQAIGSIAASVAYATYCRRLTFGQLMHLSIAAGVLATLAYWALGGTTSAVMISFVVGFAYMTGTLIQLDIAARICDVETAGTTFALLMSLTNLSVSLSMIAGGWAYDRLAMWQGYPFAFHALVGIGALCTSACWLLVPMIRRANGEQRARSLE